jgi:hypothetical protein
MNLLGVIPVWIEPLWVVVVGAAIVLAALWLIKVGLQLALPKLAVVAITTARSAMAQPLFGFELAIGAVALVVFFPILPYFTFGEDVKVVIDSGLTLIMVLSIILALWTAGSSITEEIEGRTALTLLSKPVRRWHFIVGKFLGIVAPVILMFIILGSLFLCSVSYKGVDDSHMTAAVAPTAAECLANMQQAVPGLILALFEAMVLTAISVAISTRLPMLPNLVICCSIYVLGHLVPAMSESSLGRFEVVQFMGYFIGTVFPVLDYFNIQAPISAGKPVPNAYLVWAGVYAGLYCTFAMVGALLLFDDRDLA